MSNYSKSTDFASKDTLSPGDPNKVVKGTEIDAEFEAIETAVNSKINVTDIGTTVQAYDADLTTLGAGGAGARSFLGLATIASSGSASDLSTGTVGTARLGSGTASSSTYLRGDQTWSAVTILPGTQGQVFTSTGTFTVPSGITAVKVTVIGAGGGGGASSTASSGGSGGGGGGTSISYLTGLTPGDTITATVGTGGAGGSAGGTSSFGAYCSATGGGAGGANQGSAGSGGSGSGGTINRTGGAGGSGFGYGVLSSTASGAGGGDLSSAFGFGSSELGCATYRGCGLFGQGGDGRVNSDGVGNAGETGCGGGGGYKTGSTTRAGGAGGNGIIIVEW